ncbi:MAG: phage protease [Pseudomonadota bacterium]
MDTQSAYAAFAHDLAASGEVPEWVQMFPKGPQLNAVDERRWKLSNPDALIADFVSAGRDLPLDYEHATEDPKRPLERQGVAGWITGLENRDGEVWAKIRWSDIGREDVAGARYRFVSPSFLYRKASKEIFKLTSAGLVQKPALTMAAIASDQGGPTMDEDIRVALGLAEAADTTAAVTAITELKAQASAAPDVNQWVPRADLVAAQARIAEFEDQAKAATAAALDAAVDTAVSDGKIPPASKDFWRTQAEAVGLEDFQAMCAQMPVVLPASMRRDESATAGAVLDATEAKVARAFGLTPAQFRGEDKA